MSGSLEDATGLDRIEIDQRARIEILFTKLAAKFEAFSERYERDQRSNQKDMAEILATIKSHDEFIKDIKPIYTKGVMALGAGALGIIGLGVNWIWNHVRFG